MRIHAIRSMQNEANHGSIQLAAQAVGALWFVPSFVDELTSLCLSPPALSLSLPRYTIHAPCRSLMQHTPLTQAGRTPTTGDDRADVIAQTLVLEKQRLG